jgi:hypothetical protein
MKNKTLGAIGIAFIGLLILGYFYLLYKVFTIFGLWTLVWTGIVSIFSGSALMLLATSKKVEGEKIRYNPKEWPKLLSFLVSLGIGYYLFTLLDKEALSEVDYYFALAYLATLTLLPILIGLFKLIRDRNDELIITPNTISYRDNSRFGEVELSKVSKGESYDEGYRLHLKDNTTFDIPFKKMGFSSLDKSSAIKGILDALGNEKNESDNEPSIEEQQQP